jgi:hypothetical protein
MIRRTVDEARGSLEGTGRFDFVSLEFIVNPKPTWLVLFAFTLTSFGQPGAPLPKRAAAVKHKVEALAPDAPVNVIPVQAEEEYGRFVSSDEQGFTFYDVDRKTNVTMRYLDVKKVKEGYGGYNSVRGRHTDHTRALVVTLIVVGVLGGVIGAAAAAQ